MDDYLYHGKTGLISENNIDSFVEAIETLLFDKELRNKLGTNARREVLSLGSRIENMTYMIEFFKYIKRKENL